MSDQGDDLYGLPLEEFTAARNALAKELTKAGRKDEAAAVKALKKPSVAAWALNQVVRNDGDVVARFLQQVDELRAAQDQAMGGDASALRAARRAHEAALEEVADRVTQHAASPTTRDKVLDTLRAAAVDDDARAALEAGRLVEDLHATGFETLQLTASAPVPTPAKPDPVDEKKRHRAAELAAEADDREADAEELRQEAVKAERQARAARERADDAAAIATRARERADKAAADLE